MKIRLQIMKQIMRTIVDFFFTCVPPFGIIYDENTTPNALNAHPVFTCTGDGYGAFGPALLVYDEYTTPGIRESTINVFKHGDSYGTFGPAMLV